MRVVSLGSIPGRNTKNHWHFDGGGLRSAYFLLAAQVTKIPEGKSEMNLPSSYKNYRRMLNHFQNAKQFRGSAVWAVTVSDPNF
eukprot:s692_g23.t7